MTTVSLEQAAPVVATPPKGAALTRVMRFGEFVNITPVLMDGHPIMLKDDENADDARGQVFEFFDAEERMTRAIEVWVALDPVTGGPDTVVLPNGTRGRVKLQTFDIYKRRNGTLFRFPISEGGDDQTVSNLQQTGNRRPVDLYKAKKFVYATAADVIAILRKGAANVAAAQARRAAEDPAQAQRTLVELMREAMRENNEAVAKQVTLAGLLKEQREQEQRAGQTATTGTGTFAALADATPVGGAEPAPAPEVPGGLNVTPRPPRPPRGGG